VIAAERRRTLAAVGRDLRARDGGPGEQRGGALLRRIAGACDCPIGFDDLDAVPDWLRLPRAAQRRIAQRAALLSIAPTLAGSIDGRVLRDYARVTGEEALDWAIDRAEAVPTHGLPPCEADALDARGRAMMRAALPDRLHPLIEPGSERCALPPDMARICIDEAVKGAAA
jgi:hypothetical protein